MKSTTVFEPRAEVQTSSHGTENVGACTRMPGGPSVTGVALQPVVVIASQVQVQVDYV